MYTRQQDRAANLERKFLQNEEETIHICKTVKVCKKKGAFFVVVFFCFVFCVFFFLFFF